MTRAQYLIAERTQHRAERACLLAGVLLGYGLHALLGWLAA